MRRPLVAGNWKMNLPAEGAFAFMHRLPELRERHAGVDLAVFPPATHVMVLAKALRGTRIGVGAQNCHWQASGAFTGEVSAPMLADVGARMVLVGHSERRALFGDTDEVVGRKLRAVLDARLDEEVARELGWGQEAGLEAVLCIGETQAERDAGATHDVLARQLNAALAGLPAADAARVIVAYEPVWAIGTGRVATPDMAQEAHAFTRACVAEHCGDEVAQGMRLLYGGSVKPDNAAGLFAQPDIDGGLIGGASLQVESYAALVAAADAARR